jgi:hypothetical protein
LADLRHRSNESSVNFLKRFRETRNLCFSLNVSDDQLDALAVRGMLPTLREKLARNESENLSQVAQKVSALNSQFQSVRRDTRFQKSTAAVEPYEDDYLEDIVNDEEIAAAEWN